MSDLKELLQRVVPALQRANVPFMIAGSFASAARGLPRATQDLDIVIDPTAEGLNALIAQLPSDSYYADADVAREALRTRGMFNVIDHATGWKIDFILRRNRAFSREEFERRIAVSMLDVDVFMASAEDTILAKLEWSKAREAPSASAEISRVSSRHLVTRSTKRISLTGSVSWTSKPSGP
ncbi:MAG: hypothetical protein ABIQ16_07685 [Polyangiaceae bacterium]